MRLPAAWLWQLPAKARGYPKACASSKTMEWVRLSSILARKESLGSAISSSFQHLSKQMPAAPASAPAQHLPLHQAFYTVVHLTL